MNLSEPPINIPSPRIANAPRSGSEESMIPGRAPTFADVGMRLVADGPVYAIIIVAGILAVRGTASTLEAVVAALAALLSKSWPRPVQVGTHVLIFLLLGAKLAIAAGVVGSVP
jgi:hypothetical protein